SLGEVADGWEAWLTAYPDALKKASERVRLRRLVKRLSVAKMADGELREKLGRRRSSRLSSPAIPASAILGNCRSEVVKPIEDDLDSGGLPNSDGVDVVDLRSASTTVSGGFDTHSVEASDDSGKMLICSRPRRSARADAHVELGPVLPSIAEEMDMATGQFVKTQTSSCCDDFEPSLLAPGEVADEVPIVDGGSLAGTASGVGVFPVSPFGLPLHEVPVQNESGLQAFGDDLDCACGNVVADSVHASGSVVAASLHASSVVADKLGCGILGVGKGGAVSEEVRAASGARETLRSQPTDGLRQPPSSPTGPESGVEGGGRSYAAAVRPDRRSDVRLQFVPPASHDDGMVVAATDLPDSPSQVGSSAPSLLPLEKQVEPDVLLCSGSVLGMDEKGEGLVSSVQRKSILPGTDCIGSVADFSGLIADVAGGELRVPLVSDGGQEEAVQLGAPLTAGVRLSAGVPLTAGEGLGQPSIMAVAASSDFATPMAHSAEEGSGVRGGSGQSYASAVRFNRRSDVRLHFVPPVKLDDGEELCMMDSDRDEMEWEPCLVGHFLQSGRAWAANKAQQKRHRDEWLENERNVRRKECVHPHFEYKLIRS
ncbi:hypothetical protein Dimus_036294, partial [Dionaea muscipula]